MGGNPPIAQTQSDARGNFAFEKVSTGTYDLTILAYLGFATRTVSVKLNGDTVGLNIVLANDTVSQNGL
ncbi:carboxypeptidase regulatory-like domain-containing protein [Bryocella elongata]|uniref:carboxypeptidase regulatory-like domain-containing protein n=1 Tax=Bryocella elongata TaxID=863522 RepID=UPI000CDEE351|nr:carboxypeptidase regulatory-like domain-containing protein [Bryocella elongata]